MAKSRYFFLLLAVYAALNGCGGSSSAPSSPTSQAVTEYQATLPDGTLMDLQVFADSGGVWEGNFDVETETGPDADQAGSFSGTVAGNTLNATCEAITGATFTLAGSQLSSSTIQLIRSDFPGSVLTFHLIPAPTPAKTRTAPLTFTLKVNGQSGIVSLGSVPYYETSSYTQYSGTWNKFSVYFKVFTSGNGEISMVIPTYSNLSLGFKNYPVSAFGSSTVQCYGGLATYYYVQGGKGAFFYLGTTDAVVSPP